MARGKAELRRTTVGGLLQAEVLRTWDSTQGANMALLTQEERRQYDAGGTSYQAQQTRTIMTWTPHTTAPPNTATRRASRSTAMRA